MIMKILAPVAIVVLCYLINPMLGLAATVLGLAATAFYFLPNFYAIRGNALSSKRDFEGALKWYKKAYDTGRASDNLQMVYAILLMRLGNPEPAEKILDSIARKKTAKPEIKRQAKQYRALLYCKLGRMDEAMEEARDAFETVKNTTTYGIMGYFMLLTGAPADETLKLCEEGYEYNGDDRDIVDNLAAACIRAGQYERAREYTLKLMEKHPDFVEAFYHGALAEAKLGNKKQAKEYLAKIPECHRTYMTTIPQQEIDALAASL